LRLPYNLCSASSNAWKFKLPAFSWWPPNFAPLPPAFNEAFNALMGSNFGPPPATPFMEPFGGFGKFAIGIWSTSAVVMGRTTSHRAWKSKHKREYKLTIIKHATIEMAPSIVTGVLIIIIVFMPLLTLEGLEGKLFAPVALSIVFALFSSLILSLTLIPVLSSFILKKRPDKESWLVKILIRGYKPMLKFALRFSKIIVLIVLLLFGYSIYLTSKTGKTFMPTMDEGNIIIGIEMIPSISLEESRELNLKVQKKLLKDVPEIEEIVARTGSDELGLDPMGLNDTDTFLVLKPKEEWREPSKEFVIEKIRESLEEMVGIELVLHNQLRWRRSQEEL